MKTLISLAAAVAVGAVTTGAALAQQGGQAYRMDPNAPLDFSADEADAFNPATCTTTLNGRVEVKQDRTSIRAQQLTAFHPRQRGECDTGITRWEAKGNVFYVTPDQKVRSDAAVYDNTRDIATFTGNVVAVQGENVTTGDSLVVNLNTEAFEVKGRVRGVIYPKSSGETQ